MGDPAARRSEQKHLEVSLQAVGRKRTSALHHQAHHRTTYRAPSAEVNVPSLGPRAFGLCTGRAAPQGIGRAAP